LVVVRHPVGGIRTYLKYTYKYLDPLKYQFTIVTVRNPEGSHIEHDLKILAPHIIEIDESSNWYRFIRAIYDLLAANEYDLIHSHGYTAGIMAAVVNHYFNLPHIVTSHGLFEKGQFTVTKYGKIKKLLVGYLLSKVDVIQSVSNDAEENVKEYFPKISKKKLKVIHNGVDIATFYGKNNEYMRKALKIELNIDRQYYIYGYLGRFMPEKGFEKLIDAVEILSEDQLIIDKIKILVVNDGAYIREYKALIERRKLSKYFMFHGFIPDIRRILEGIDALVIPSLWEAYGLIAAEALLVSCPIIASECIGLREVITSTPAIKFKTADAQSLANAMRFYIDNIAEIRAKTESYLPTARERYDSRKTAAKLDALFDETIEKRGWR